MDKSCPQCGHQSDTGSRFCSQCGAALPAGAATTELFLQAEHVLPSNFRALVPPTLADKIRSATSKLSGERREVSVLRVALALPQFHGAPRGSEAAYLRLKETLQQLVAIVHEYEGHVDRASDTGLTALFGAPVMHENDPERAVRAALQMVERFRLFAAETGRFPPDAQHLCIGIHTGSVIIGNVGRDWEMEYTAIGDTLDLANELAETAAPNAILVSDVTHLRTRAIFHYGDLDPRSPGAPRPTATIGHQPLAIRDVAYPTAIHSSQRRPLIGRAEPLHTLSESLDQVVTTGQPQAVIITGEAGVGKSRLIGEFEQHLRGDPLLPTFVQAHCTDYARPRPYALVNSLITRLLGSQHESVAAQRTRQLEAFLTKLGLDVGEFLPYLLHLDGTAERQPIRIRQLQRYDAAMLQDAANDALRLVLHTLARQAPLVLVLEDMNWIDDASWSFVQHLVQATHEVPLLLLLVTRTENRRQIADLENAISHYMPPARLLHLPRLSPLENRQLLANLLPGLTESQAGAEIERALVERADGNPRFLEEIVRMLLDEGGLVQSDEGLRIDPTAGSLVERVPGTLQGLILTRYDTLDEAARELLQEAAVLGQSFPELILRQLHAGTDLPLEPQIEQLIERQFLIRQAAPEDGRIAFRHQLIRDAVYGTLLRRKRRQLHTDIARAISAQTQWGHDEKAELLAYHFAHSEETAAALPYLLTAGENAVARYANESAARHFREYQTLHEQLQLARDSALFRATLGLGQALKNLGRYAEAEETLRATIAGTAVDQQAIHFMARHQLADSLQRAGHFDDAVTILQEGLALLNTAQSPREATLQQSLIERLAFVHFRLGNLEVAFDLAQQAASDALTSPAEDPVTLANLFNTLGGITWQMGDTGAAIRYVKQSLGIYQKLGYTRGVADAYNNLGILNARHGQWPQTIANWEKALELRREMGDVQSQTNSLINLGQLYLMMGRYAAARENLQSGLDLAERLNEAWEKAQARANLAQLALTESDFLTAQGHAQEALTLGEELDARHLQIQSRWILASALAEQDQVQEGLQLVRQGLALAETGGLSEGKIDCLRVLGLLEQRSGRLHEAETALKESVELAHQMGDPYRHGRALLALGELYARRAAPEVPGRIEWQRQAEQALAAAEEKFTDLGAAADTTSAQQALRALAGARPTGRTGAVAEPAGQRHMAAILWLTLTRPAGIDDEEAFESFALLLAALATIAREGGAYVQRQPDGLLAAFGVPIAHEDDRERAVAAAWQIHLYVQQHEPRWAERMQLLVDYGDLVAGSFSALGQGGYVLEGAVVTRARDRVSVVPPGRLAATADVRARTEHRFIFQELPDAQDAASPLWEIAEPRPQPTRARGVPGVRANFVGRTGALDALNQIATNLRSDIGGVALIEGEAGIGKSRLMEEFRGSGTLDRARYWSGACAPQLTHHPFALFVDLLSQVFGLQAQDGEQEIRARIVTVMQEWPARVWVTQPYLELLCGVQPSGTSGDRLRSLEPDQLRQQIFVAIRRLLQTLSAERPLILFLDDLHWIDPVSAELLVFLATIAASEPILFICAQRREGGDSPNDRLRRLQELLPRQTVHLTLERLSVRESNELINELLPTNPLPEAIQERIVDRSEGNPYFIEEYIRALLEDGYLRRTDSGWTVDPALNERQLSLPTSLQALLRTRIDNLPDDLKHVVQLAAVLGRDFNGQLMNELLDAPDAPLRLQRLDARLILVSDPATDRWRFRHRLFQTVIYESMLESQQRALHLRLGEVLERKWVDDADLHAAELAYHFQRGGHTTAARRYLVLAGEQAASRHAVEEALIHLRAAAELAAQEPVADAALNWRIAVAIGDAYRLGGAYAESWEALQTVLPQAKSGRLSLRERAGLYRRLGATAQKQGNYDVALRYFEETRSTIGNSTEPQLQRELAQALWGAAWVHFARGDFDAARSAGEESLRLAVAADGLNEQANAENLLGGIHYQLGQWRAALDRTTRAMVLREQMGYSWGVAKTLGNMGILSFSAGQWDKALDFFARSLEQRRELGDVEGVAIALNNLALVYREQGKLNEAEALFRESVGVAATFDIAYHAANSSAGLTSVLLLLERVDDARDAWRDAVSQAEAIGAQDVLIELRRLKAEIFLRCGDNAAAETAAADSAKAAAEIGNASHEAAGWRVAAEASRRRGQLKQAHAYIDRAQVTISGVPDELERARIALQRGAVLRDSGDSAAAESAVSTARQIITRLGAALYLEQVASTAWPAAGL